MLFSAGYTNEVEKKLSRHSLGVVQDRCNLDQFHMISNVSSMRLGRVSICSKGCALVFTSGWILKPGGNWAIVASFSWSVFATLSVKGADWLWNPIKF